MLVTAMPSRLAILDQNHDRLRYRGLIKITVPMIPVAPDPDRDYPVVLGETFTIQSAANYHSLQYKFKPQSAGRSRPGSVQLSQSSASAQP